MSNHHDVIVVGAGIIGCAVAFELAERGARVLVVDRREPGHGATQASAGILSPFIEADPGSPLLRLGVRSLDLYPEFVARVVEASGAEVEFSRSGTLQIALDEGEADRLGRVANDLPEEAGARVLDAAGVRDLEPDVAGCANLGLLIERHAFVAPLALTRALVGAATARGATFVHEEAVQSVERADVGSGGRPSGALAVTTATRTLTAGSVVLAAGGWAGCLRLGAGPSLPVWPVRGQLLHLAFPAPPLRRVVWAPGCYLVPWRDGSLLVGATIEDVGFDEHATVEGVTSLLQAATRVLPRVGEAAFRGVRVGLRPGTPDAMPVVGQSSTMPGLIYAAGHYRNGVLLTPLTARIVSELVLEDRRDPALEELSPGRFDLQL